MAQADELARLKDEVRGSAEREAMEIVTAARRDIRKIVMEARRELFVLSAQVQAALGETPAAPQIGSPAVAHDDDRPVVEEELEAFAQEEWGFAPRSTVAAVLEEARADIAILDQDARAVPAPARADSGTDMREYPSEEAPPAPSPPASRIPLVTSGLSAPEIHDPSSVRWFAAVFVLAAFVVVLGTVWALRPDTPPGSNTAPVTPQTPDSTTGASGAAATTVAEPSATAADPTAVRLSIEAVRPAWIRAVVDGRGDESGQMLQAGETYEFTGRNIALRVGDAGAVLVSVNGSEARPLGRDGQVVNRQFTLDEADASGESRAPDEDAIRGEPSAPREEVATASPSPAVLASEPLALPPPDPVAIAANTPLPVAATNGQANAAAPAPAVERTASLAGDTGSQPAESTLVATAQRWLDAYHRQDQVMLSVLSTPGVIIADERPTTERIPITAGAIARTLERVSIRFAADTAVMTGIMTERAVNGGLQRSSPVSLMWVADGDSWRLSQARLVAQSTLGQIFR